MLYILKEKQMNMIVQIFPIIFLSLFVHNLLLQASQRIAILWDTFWEMLSMGLKDFCCDYVIW